MASNVSKVIAPANCHLNDGSARSGALILSGRKFTIQKTTDQAMAEKKIPHPALFIGASNGR